jgi:hypothetical protein
MSVRRSDWVGFGQNQNPNYIGFRFFEWVFSCFKLISTQLPDPTHFFGLDWMDLTRLTGFAQSIYIPNMGATN